MNYLGIEPTLNPIVRKVIDNSPAFKSGLKPKDQILEISNIKVFDVKEVIGIIEELV